MNVYVVQGHWDYEGSSLIGVYSTKEAAMERAKAERDNFDQTTAAEMTLDNPDEGKRFLATYDNTIYGGRR